MSFNFDDKRLDQKQPQYDYKMEEFRLDLALFGIKETDYENPGTLNALYLLMRGKFHNELNTLLQEEETPESVKLLICNFLIRGRYFESHEIVQKTLVTVFHTNLTEWKKTREKEVDTV